eukprot:g21833.t1
MERGETLASNVATALQLNKQYQQHVSKLLADVDAALQANLEKRRRLGELELIPYYIPFKSKKSSAAKLPLMLPALVDQDVAVSFASSQGQHTASPAQEADGDKHRLVMDSAAPRRRNAGVDWNTQATQALRSAVYGELRAELWKKQQLSVLAAHGYDAAHTTHQQLHTANKESKAKDAAKSEKEVKDALKKEKAKISTLNEEELLAAADKLDWASSSGQTRQEQEQEEQEGEGEGEGDEASHKVDWEDALDWTRVAQADGLRGEHDAQDCECHWRGEADPRIFKGDWTVQEEKDLLTLVSGPDRDWLDIAAELNTNRTPLQVVTKWQRSINRDFLNSKWSAEEDAKLTQLVEELGTSNWMEVSWHMPGRSDQQCLNRWCKSLDPTLRSGRWTEQEDIRLQLAVKAYGTRAWSKIQRHLQARSDTKCRERFVNVLDPKVDKSDWSREEDTRLLDLVQQHRQGNWKAVAKDMGGTRTDNACKRRWQKLRPIESEEYYREHARKKQFTMSNFQGRIKEKTKMTAKDVSEVLGEHSTTEHQMLPPLSSVAHQAGQTSLAALFLERVYYDMDPSAFSDSVPARGLGLSTGHPNLMTRTCSGQII